jgi:hypothetical protein
VHLKAVADLVAGVTDDPEMIAAAWLYDVVEDTPITLDDVAREFGGAVRLRSPHHWHQIAGLSRRLDDWMLEQEEAIVDLPR